jgi:hypothetical protein
MRQHRFTFAVAAAGTELRLLAPGGDPVPFDLWPLQAPPALLPGVDLVQRLEGAGTAVAEGDEALIEHGSVAGLSVAEAGRLGLPPLVDAVARIDTRGVMMTPGFSAALRWERPSGQAIAAPERIGAWLRIGDGWGRIPEPLYGIAEAVERFAAAAPDSGERWQALQTLRELLPDAQEKGEARAPGLIGSMSIAVADAFSLDLAGEGGDARLVPILHRADAAADTPLLPSDQQQKFGDELFNRFSTARGLYSLGNGRFLVLAPVLQRALQVVRAHQSSSTAVKRQFLASPRAFLREALEDDEDGTLVERVFRETKAYGERVLGLGLWQARVLPWVQVASTDWLGPETDGREGARPPESGIRVGERHIPLTREQTVDLMSRVEEAIGQEKPTVPFEAGDGTVEIPAEVNTLHVLRDVLAKIGPRPRPPEPASAPEVLRIAANEEEVDLEGEFKSRHPLTAGQPQGLLTPLKPHQVEGLAWLQQAWLAGRPGVLLADDMGLGKTLQGLAFLAWLRQGMQAASLPRAPLLIVAPTGLLESWQKEHRQHLAAPGLGTCLPAYGRGLAELRRRSDDGGPGLDVERLKRADWVLTTFETLRDYDRDFGRVAFAAKLMDEAQKIKTPGIRLTDAAKAMNADFRVAMTGTPVENRLADLWCIVDTVHPAYLGDLKSFSANYERDADVQKLQQLKATLDQRRGRTPPLLLRRLREDRLPDLPSHTVAIAEREMPPAQAEGYMAAVAAARSSPRRGAVLEALQRLRRVCLHPDPEAGGDDESFIGMSARLALAFEALDRIRAKAERALIFVDDLPMQARLAGLIQRRYGLHAPPMLINGTVAGGKRQARVDLFQKRDVGFDCMILSPRAGGVGLTLTSANHVLHLARWWNPAVEDQCNGRAIRIGQTRPVTVHLPLAVCPDDRRSFDQNLHALLERKRRLMHEALLPPAMSEGEQAELLSQTVDAR